ncbi:MAG: hypothetical protein U9Q66_02360 [Patescibacteria group bacterium]|nr:hypothetical protein [Patescibacteria group bacterium]
MRLDSGNLAEQAAYALKEQVKTGMMDPTRDKIIVADISTIDDIRIAEEACAEALE